MPPPLPAGEQELSELAVETEEVYTQLSALDSYDVIRRAETKRCKHPLVMVMGNFSSGKSTFVNSLFPQSDAAQDVSAAPTDAGFTLLMRTSGGSNHAQTIAGSAVLDDPELGFTELQEYGDALANRLTLKRLPISDVATVFPEGTMLLDTPGLTDFESCEHDAFPAQTLHNVLLWFAEHADMVLYLMDPLKPGGAEQKEVLTRLTRSGLDHKIKFVFNKCDALESVGDAVSTFGTLCWTLSKYLPRKDPPMFYTTFTETAGEGHKGMETFRDECVQRRAELLKCVRQVPYNRASTLIKQTQEAHTRLEVANISGTELLHRARRQRTQYYTMLSLFSLLLVTIFSHLYESVESEDPLSSVVLYSLVLIMAVGVMAGCLCKMRLLEFYDKLLRDEGDDCFRSGFAKGYKDEGDLERLIEARERTWQAVKSGWNVRARDLASISGDGDEVLRCLNSIAETIQKLHVKAQDYRDALDGAR